MPQMLRLSQGHWLNLEQLVYVEDQAHAMELTLNFSVANEHGYTEAYTLYLHGEERERLLAWLAHHSAYVDMPRAANDDDRTGTGCSDEDPPF